MSDFGQPTTYPRPILSDSGKPTYLPKNRTSFMDGPLHFFSKIDGFENIFSKLMGSMEPIEPMLTPPLQPYIIQWCLMVSNWNELDTWSFLVDITRHLAKIFCHRRLNSTSGKILLEFRHH